MDANQRRRLVKAMPGALDALKRSHPHVEDAQYDAKSGAVTITMDPVTTGEPTERQAAADLAANAIERANNGARK